MPFSGTREPHPCALWSAGSPKNTSLSYSLLESFWARPRSGIRHQRQNQSAHPKPSMSPAPRNSTHRTFLHVDDPVGVKDVVGDAFVSATAHHAGMAASASRRRERAISEARNRVRIGDRTGAERVGEVHAPSDSKVRQRLLGSRKLSRITRSFLLTWPSLRSGPRSRTPIVEGVEKARRGFKTGIWMDRNSVGQQNSGRGQWRDIKRTT